MAGRLAALVEADLGRTSCAVSLESSGTPRPSTLAYLSLYALQHRGQESAGIVTCDGDRFVRRAGMGQVADVFSRDVLEDSCRGSSARSATCATRPPGDSTGTRNAQPFLLRHHRGTDRDGPQRQSGQRRDGAIREELEADGSIFQTTSDTETILHLAARADPADVVDALVNSLRQLRGAYSLVTLVPGRLIAARDPHGFRPLSIGRVDGAWVVASETCAFDLLGAEHVRDLDRGRGRRHRRCGTALVQALPEPSAPAPCFFEHVYFSPGRTARFFGDSVQAVRQESGPTALGRSTRPTWTASCPVPDSGIYAALGYARASGLPFEMGLVRNHYVGRTFIEPSQQIRNFGVRVKLNPVREILEGRRASP